MIHDAVNALKTEKKKLVFRDYSLSNDYQVFTHISVSGIFKDAFIIAEVHLRTDRHRAI